MRQHFLRAVVLGVALIAAFPTSAGVSDSRVMVVVGLLPDGDHHPGWVLSLSSAPDRVAADRALREFGRVPGSGLAWTRRGLNPLVLGMPVSTGPRRFDAGFAAGSSNTRWAWLAAGGAVLTGVAISSSGGKGRRRSEQPAPVPGQDGVPPSDDDGQPPSESGGEEPICPAVVVGLVPGCPWPPPEDNCDFLPGPYCRFIPE